MEYREAYFEEPGDLTLKLQGDFVNFATGELRKILFDTDVNEDTVVAVNGVASLFGFTKVSLILKEIEQDIRGRLILFFPGEFENNNYRLPRRSRWLELFSGSNNLA